MEIATAIVMLPSTLRFVLLALWTAAIDRISAQTCTDGTPALAGNPSGGRQATDIDALLTDQVFKATRSEGSCLLLGTGKLWKRVFSADSGIPSNVIDA